MNKYVAALYSNGRMVTGSNHGDAFSKLSVMEQDGEMESGFYDPSTGRFFTEEYDFYLKQILLVRHGEPSGTHPDADLTDAGVRQIHRTAQFLCQHFDLSQFETISSPHFRCRRTADIISRTTGVNFSTDQQLREREIPENARTYSERIGKALGDSPVKAIYVSHADFIVNFAERAVGRRITECGRMPHGSVTFIDARRLVWCGKDFTA